LWGKTTRFFDGLILFSPLCSDTYGYFQHEIDVRAILCVLLTANLKANPKKTSFGQFSMDFLGYELSAAGIGRSPKHTRAIDTYPVPKDLKMLRNFLGLVQFFSTSIKDRAQLVSPLTKLLRKGVQFHWGQDQQCAYDKLKSVLTGEAILGYPNFEERFLLFCDTSTTGVGASLAQYDTALRQVKVISYIGMGLSPAHTKIIHAPI
jgi:hypothetical protein